MMIKNGNFNIIREMVYVNQLFYLVFFIWVGFMMVIVYFIQQVVFFLYVVDVFGVEELNNEVVFGVIVVWVKGEVKFQQIFIYFEINFIVGIINFVISIYVKQNVIEVDDNDLDGKDIVEGLWVREVLYLIFDIMFCLVILNLIGIFLWQSLESYIEIMIWFLYMVVWSLLQRSYELNSILFIVDLYEVRIQVVVLQWRVISWFGINVVFLLFWIIVIVLMKRSKELVGVDIVFDFILWLYIYFEYFVQ